MWVCEIADGVNPKSDCSNRNNDDDDGFGDVMERMLAARLVEIHM